MATPNVVDTEQLASAAWSLRDHPDREVRDLALGANEAAHDIAALLSLVAALLKRIAERDGEVAALRGKLAAAELEIMNRVKVIAVLTGETPAPIEYVDPLWLTTLRNAGAL